MNKAVTESEIEPLTPAVTGLIGETKAAEPQ